MSSFYPQKENMRSVQQKNLFRKNSLSKELFLKNPRFVGMGYGDFRNEVAQFGETGNFGKEIFRQDFEKSVIFYEGAFEIGPK